MKQIGVFLYPERSTNDYMLSSNGTVIFHPLSAYVEFKRNSIWYLKVEFPIADLHGKELPNEAIFKVDLTYAKNQFFRMIYKKIDRKKNTYTCYCNHVFFDSQKEVIVFDKRSINTNWSGAINTANTIISECSPRNPYHVYGEINGQTTTAYWEDYNLIQCLFGTEDNTLINRWEDDVKQYHPTAMFDNFNCYFGDGEKYPDAMKPKNIYFSTSSEIEDNSLTETMENTVTGIIPKAYNGYMLPNHEIVKSSKYDQYKIHRIEFRKYDDIKLKEDASEDEKDTAYDTMDQVYTALREAANKDLALEDVPEKTYKLKPVDLPQYKNQRKIIKTNDYIVLVDEKTGVSETKFYIESYKFDLIKETTDSIEVSELR